MKLLGIPELIAEDVAAALLEKARNTLSYSYSPYSNYQVAAALLTKSGKIYTGVNVENASYGGTICAERTAIVKAVSEGEREFRAIAIVSATEQFTSPCGICRQFIVEFGRDIVLIFENHDGYDMTAFTVEEMLPHCFVPEHLEREPLSRGRKTT